MHANQYNPRQAAHICSLDCNVAWYREARRRIGVSGRLSARTSDTAHRKPLILIDVDRSA